MRPVSVFHVFLLLQIFTSVISVICFVCEHFCIIKNFIQACAKSSSSFFVSIHLYKKLLSDPICGYIYDMPPYQISTPCFVISVSFFLEIKEISE